VQVQRDAIVSGQSNSIGSPSSPRTVNRIETLGPRHGGSSVPGRGAEAT